MPPLQQMKRQVPCAVCQMPSTGRHYGVYCCGGCRNFFRRSIALHKTYNCNHGKGVNFSKCKMCRFNACLSAGMSMEAIKVGRPTDKEKAAVSEYLEQLTSSQSNGKTSQSNLTIPIAVEPLIKQFQEKLVCISNQYQQMTQDNGFNHPLFHSHSSFWDIFSHCIQKLEQQIGDVSHLVRSMPGMSSKVAVADRVTIFTKAVFPILIFRSFSQPNCFDPLCTLFGIDQSTAALLFQNFNQQNIAYLHQYLSQLNYEFQTLQFNEQEIAMIFGLLCFDYNLLANTFMDNRQAVQSVATIYAQLSEALSESTFGRAQQIQQFVTKLAQVYDSMLLMAQEFLYIQGEGHGSNLLKEIVRSNSC